jgi:purine nucleosidase
MERKKIILDTDIGTDIDDALALAYLLYQPNCELIGITTLTGQADIRAEMASAMLHAANRSDIPIHVGTMECILIEQKERYAAQSIMLDKWPHDTGFPNDAILYLQRTIRENPGEITLLGISPMSNIARLFLMDPEIPSLLKELYLMCGKFSDCLPCEKKAKHPNADGKLNNAFVPANINSFMANGALEMNALIDPFATAVVYKSLTPIHRSIGVDMTSRVTMTRDEFIAKCMMHPIFKPIMDMAGVWFEHSESVTFHDPLATVCVFNDNICEFTRGDVAVEIESRMLRGFTTFCKNCDGKNEVAVNVDVDKFFEEYYSVFK